MAGCNACDGTGYVGASWEHNICRACAGTGEGETNDDIRARCYERAIENTGYRSGGAEMADTMEGRKPPVVVDMEYRRLCKKSGVSPK